MKSRGFRLTDRPVPGHPVQTPVCRTALLERRQTVKSIVENRDDSTLLRLRTSPLASLSTTTKQRKMVVEVDPDDTEFANSLIDYVVTSVKVWHEKNPDSMNEIEEAREAWMKILKMLGPKHRHRLRSKELEFTKDEGQNEKLILSDEGIPIEAFAASCADLRRVEVAVRKWITYGDPSLDSDESELDDPDGFPLVI